MGQEKEVVPLCLWVTLQLSLRFNGHFPGEPGLAGVYWSKGWWRWWWQLDYWSCKSCKAPVISPPPTNQHPVFYKPDALLVTQPTVSKHWREKYHIPWTCLPQAHLGSSNFVSGQRVAMPLISPLMPVPQVTVLLLGKYPHLAFCHCSCFQLYHLPYYPENTSGSLWDTWCNIIVVIHDEKRGNEAKFLWPDALPVSNQQ